MRANSEGTTDDSGSIHATAGSTTGALTQDNTLANVRCSYCHKVHTSSTSNKPFLRGTWTPNPFPEDGAPRNGVTYAAANFWGGVPRGESLFPRKLSSTSRMFASYRRRNSC